MKHSLATLTAVPAMAIMLLGLAAPVSARTVATPRNTALHWGYYFGGGRQQDQTVSPTPINLPAPVKQLSTSNSTQYALLTNGQVWAWGQGAKGELGNGSDTNSFKTPVQVRFPAGVTIAFMAAEANPYDSALAVDTTGRAWAWGFNRGAEFCNGTRQPSDVPIQVPLPGRVTALAGANNHAIYVVDGTVYACGQNYDAATGTGSALGYDYSPTPVRGLPAGKAVTAVTASFGNSGALLADGQYWDWGMNTAGQSGNGIISQAPVSSAVWVNLPGPVAQVYEGGSLPYNGQTLVMLSSGALYAWGAGHHGQLGTGNTKNQPSPVRIHAPTGVKYATLATGGATSYAIDTNGHVWSWGEGLNGELGNGTTEAKSLRPVEIIGGAAMVSSTAGDVAIAAIR